MGSLQQSTPSPCPSPRPFAELGVPMETDLLVVGAGPAGASLACFLARYGLKGIVISAAPGTADTPRAHIHNMATFECLRDIGVYDECERLGNKGETIMHYRWAETMSGEEYARNYSWGNGTRKGDYDMVSPCTHMDLPQSLLEPILVKYATHHGFKVRFDTQLLSFFPAAGDRTTCLVLDRATNTQYHITTKYLFGADGGRSIIARDLALPMTVIPGGGLAYNVVARVDLSHIMPYRHGNLHWCLRTQRDYPFMCVARMIKPWHEWMFVFFPKGPDAPITERSDEEWKELIQDCIGEEAGDVDVEILGVSKWLVNETSADVISKGNVFCLGDAIHRHPPTLGLGSNTGIQDAFNLAWKIALVKEGAASPKLLDTYNAERQPVGAQLVKASNDILRKHIVVWQSLGCMPYGTSEEERLRGIKELKSVSEEGRQRRKALKESIADMQNETQALGIEMGQLYKSEAVYTKNEKSEFSLQGREAENPHQYYEACTYPGRRLPHVWLGKRIPGPLVSTLDVAGNGRFTLFIGIEGEAWKKAAEELMINLKVQVKVVEIGRGLEWEDRYFDWEEKRGVEDDGCVLVRPDFFVAWRSERVGSDADCTRALHDVMRTILCLD